MNQITFARLEICQAFSVEDFRGSAVGAAGTRVFEPDGVIFGIALLCPIAGGDGSPAAAGYVLPKRSSLAALCPNKIPADEPKSDWWPASDRFNNLATCSADRELPWAGSGAGWPRRDVPADPAPSLRLPPLSFERFPIARGRSHKRPCRVERRRQRTFDRPSWHFEPAPAPCAPAQ